MTDELLDYGIGSHIIKFVSGGPKTYAYLVWSTDKQAVIPVCNQRPNIKHENIEIAKFRETKGNGT